MLVCGRQRTLILRHGYKLIVLICAKVYYSSHQDDEAKQSYEITVNDLVQNLARKAISE